MTATMKRIFDGKVNGHTVRVIATVGLGGNDYRVIVNGARVAGVASDSLTLADGIERGKSDALTFLQLVDGLVGTWKDVDSHDETPDETV